jgi:hypothetical protein
LPLKSEQETKFTTLLSYEAITVSPLLSDGDEFKGLVSIIGVALKQSSRSIIGENTTEQPVLRHRQPAALRFFSRFHSIRRPNSPLSKYLIFVRRRKA